jgi:hypothetical protein
MDSDSEEFDADLERAAERQRKKKYIILYAMHTPFLCVIRTITINIKILFLCFNNNARAAATLDGALMSAVVIDIGGDDLVDNEEARKLEESGKLRHSVKVDRLANSHSKVCFCDVNHQH